MTSEYIVLSIALGFMAVACITLGVQLARVKRELLMMEEGVQRVFLVIAAQLSHLSEKKEKVDA